jgi:hypothetical protein
MILAGNVARIRENMNECKGLLSNPEEKRPLRRPRLRWKDIKTDHGKI